MVFANKCEEILGYDKSDCKVNNDMFMNELTPGDMARHGAATHGHARQDTATRRAVTNGNGPHGDATARPSASEAEPERERSERDAIQF